MATIKSCGYFNNPEFAQAAQNLSGLFAPPSGAEAAGWAAANAKREEAQRLASLFAYSQDPNFNQQKFDRMGIGAGAWNPSQSYYGVDQQNATSRANNANTVRGAVIGQLYGPLSVNQVRPEVPGVTMSTVGLPAAPAAYGIQKPQTLSEAQAQTYSGLTPEEQRAILFNGSNLVDVIGPNGTPQKAFAGEAAGMQPYLKPDIRPNAENYRLPDGRMTSAAIGADGVLRDTQTSALLPSGSVKVHITAQNLADAGVKTTEAQDRAGYAGAMSEPATESLIKAFSDPKQLPTTQDFRLFSLLRRVPAELQPEVVQNISPAGQRFYQDIRSALPYQLMAQSGQAVTEQEYERKLLELVPVPGEDPGVTVAKQRQFTQYRTAIRGMAGPAYQKSGGAPTPGAVPPTAGAAPSAQQPGSILRYNPATGRIE